jgi:hypothetical protein
MKVNVVEVLIGVVAIVVSVLALWIALPKGGQVRSWLRSHTRQALYAVMVLSIFAYGMTNIVTGLVP